MVREFKLPDVGEGLTEAEIVSWLVEPGDAVEEDQPVAEVETDKAVVEVPSPVNGTVKEILAEEGEMVPVGEVIITFEVEGETEADEGAAVEPEPAEGAEGEAAGPESAVEPVGEADAEAADAEAGPSGDGASAGGRVFAAPSARRLARELDVDIAGVDGSGPGGRITEGDVRAAAEGAGDAEPVEEETGEVEEEQVDDAFGSPPETGAEAGTGSPAAGAADVEAADRDRTLAAPATRKLADELDVDLDAVPATEERDGEAFVTPEAVREYAEAQRAAQAADAEAVQAAGEERDREERVPYRGIRRTIGRQMEKSKFTAPHVTHFDDADVSELVEIRADLKEEAAERGIRLTYMPFVIKTAVAALKEHPIVNSRLDEENEQIVKKHYYNIGVATATEAGLMVPVVQEAHRKGLLQIASEMNELVERAQERSISREEMQDGTFTLTNFGAIGGEYASPIINYPETAILGLGAIKERPRVVDGEVVPRRTLTLSLSIDHRVIDGADAAAFVNTLKGYLENPHRLLLE